MAAPNWDTIKNLLNSRAGEMAMTLGGAGITAYAQGKQADKDRAQAQNQFATTSQLALQRGRDDRAVSAANASPLGANEQFAAKMAMLREVMPGLRNFSVTPGDPAVAAAMGKTSGGFRLPEGGLSPEALAHFSKGATANALSQRQQHIANIDPNAPGINLQGMGFDAETAAPYQTAADAFQRGRQDEQSRAEKLLQAALDRDYAMTQQAQQKKKGGGFLGALGGIFKAVAPMAAFAIPGVGPVLGSVLAGAGTAAGTKMQGGSWGDAVAQGALGAASSRMGRPSGGRPAPSVPRFDPVTYSPINRRFPG